MRTKLERLKEIFREAGSALVAYSGGVDSSFLAAVAHEVLGERALAVIGRAPTYPPAEIEGALRLARERGWNHLLIETEQMEDRSFVVNASDRCFHCKSELFEKLGAIARERGLALVADGANADDLADFRPGQQAAAKYGVRSPLQEVGLNKVEIRLLSREMGLPTWDKPSAACLSSRFPYGTPISLEVLERLDAAESFLRSLGVRQLRVRHHGELARIEVEQGCIAQLTSAEVRQAIVRRFRELGYTYVTLDLAGYRTGSMNEVLPGLSPVSGSPDPKPTH